MAKIFASVGTHPQNFDRLFKELDEIAEEKSFKDEIFGQLGSSDFVPKNFKSKKFLNSKEYSEKISESDIVISHGGAGTIINALKENKKVIVVPRLKKFNEHTDDHQVDLAMAMEKEGKAIAVYEINDLENAIERAKKFNPKLESTREKMVREIENFLNENFAKNEN